MACGGANDYEPNIAIAQDVYIRGQVISCTVVHDRGMEAPKSPLCTSQVPSICAPCPEARSAVVLLTVRDVWVGAGENMPNVNPPGAYSYFGSGRTLPPALCYHLTKRCSGL